MAPIKEITIQVSPEVADAYESASPQERKKIQDMIGIFLQKPADRDLALLREIMDDISDRAAARGWFFRN
jgi:hypothetical protein